MKTPTWDAATLKAKREKDGLSAEKLANILGASKENIYKWESGTRPMKKEMSKRIEEYINGAEIKPNGIVHIDDFKEKYYTLLEEHVSLLKKLVNPTAP